MLQVCLHLRTVKLLVATQRSVIIIPKQVCSQHYVCFFFRKFVQVDFKIGHEFDTFARPYIETVIHMEIVIPHVS